MADLKNEIAHLNLSTENIKTDIIDLIQDAAVSSGYKIVDRNDTKPWGAFLRFHSSNTEAFLEEFFPGLTLDEAQLGISGAELSPKILLVSPGHRLSWQLHHRRAERWRFLTAGGYHKSSNDDPGGLITAKAGDVVQFLQGERHRLSGIDSTYVLVAEIWQHTDVDNLSDEDDIVRLEDDYSR